MRHIICAVTFAMVGAAETPAAAQVLNDFRPTAVAGGFVRDRDQDLIDRTPAEYQSLGLRLGSFRVDPSLGVSATYTDNAQFRENNGHSDGIFEFRPSVVVNSDWSRNALGAYVSADIARYADFGTENTNNWTVGSSGRLDIGVDTTLSGNASYSELREPRSSSSSPEDVLRPVFYTLAQANATLQHTFNRLRLTGTAAVRDYDYSDARRPDGAVVDEDFRDDTQYTVTGRGDYSLTPDKSVFMQVEYDRFDYDPITSAGFDRSSDAVLVLGGATIDLTEVLRAELGVGYLTVDHDAPTRRDVSGFSARSSLVWYPTRLTTVTASASRDFRDTGIAQSTGAVTDLVNVRVDHELKRNIILSGNAGFQRNDYQQIDRTDTHWSTGFTVRYLLNRRVSLNAEYALLVRDSRGLQRGSDFTANALTVGATLHY